MKQGRILPRKAELVSMVSRCYRGQPVMQESPRTPAPPACNRSVRGAASRAGEIHDASFDDRVAT
jgi:hypothetical protein